MCKETEIIVNCAERIDDRKKREYSEIVEEMLALFKGRDLLKKRTHFALSRQLLKDNEHKMNRIQSWLFCLGSIFPDTTPLCLIKPHKINVTDYKSKKRMVRLFFIKSNHYADSFRLGCLSHHLADYFTAPHNRYGVKGFCMDHRGYEERLHSYFKQELKTSGARKEQVEDNELSAFSFWSALATKHQEYLNANHFGESILTDYQFISEMIGNLFHVSMERRLPSYA